jgi:hypothetical protein
VAPPPLALTDAGEDSKNSSSMMMMVYLMSL